MTRQALPLLICSLAGSALILFGAHDGEGAIFNIADGDVSGLKNAINISNANSEDDTIELATTGSYLLINIDNGINGLPSVGADGGKKLTIHGNGATIQRSTDDGTPSFRILFINTGADVTISNLTISSGLLDDDDGAGIYNDGATLTASNCAFVSNTAGFAGGGIWNGGPLTLNSSTFSSNVSVFGGAIANQASATLNGCAVSGNSAADGGGVSNSGDLAVNRGTFSGNSAFGDIGGGAIYSETENGDASVAIVDSTLSGNSADKGGAIYTNALSFAQITVTISNGTLSSNSAVQGGGIYNHDAGNGDSVAFLQVTNSTLGSNTANVGGGIYNDVLSGVTSAKVVNTILSAGASGSNIAGGQITSQGHNLSSDNGSGYLTATGDQINTDPQLDPAGLQNNGGPTQTIALLATSPAIDHGDDANAPSRDQRSYARNGVSDIGAFEYNGALTPLSAVSRKNHAGSDFDLSLPLTGPTVGVECRRNTGADASGPNAGHDHLVVVTFPYPVAIDSATGDHSVAVDTLPSGFNQVYSLNLHNVPDAQLITLTLNNVRDNTNAFNDTIPMGLLFGDVNGDGFVLSGDYTAVRQKSGTPVDASTFQFDINVDGFILSGDYTAARQQSGTHLGASIDPMEKPRSRSR
jgi:predicted outer membrane repeat protein